MKSQFNRRRPQNTRQHRINNEIRSPQVRITKEDPDLGVIDLKEALAIAEERNVDLIEISPNTNPPVCILQEYGKFIYQKQKREKESKKASKSFTVKEVKFRPNTDEGDYQVKLRNLKRWFEEGDKAKITVRFRGREIVHADLGHKLIERLKQDLEGIAVVESSSGNKVENRQIVVLMGPPKKK